MSATESADDASSRSGNPASATRTVVVGVVGKPFGVSGGCYVRPDPDVEHDFAAGTRYPTATGDLVVTDRHDHGTRMILTFSGIATREDAQELRGTVLRVDASAVALDPESVWAEEVVGADVIDPDGNLLGVVDHLADGPAHDYLVVSRPHGAPVWVPAVAELMTFETPAPGAPRGDDERRRSRIVVTPLPGLFDTEAGDSDGPQTQGG